jgi:hypothetical protein
MAHDVFYLTYKGEALEKPMVRCRPCRLFCTATESSDVLCGTACHPLHTHTLSHTYSEQRAPRKGSSGFDFHEFAARIVRRRTPLSIRNAMERLWTQLEFSTRLSSRLRDLATYADVRRCVFALHPQEELVRNALLYYLAGDDGPNVESY